MATATTTTNIIYLAVVFLVSAAACGYTVWTVVKWAEEGNVMRRYWGGGR